MSIDTIRTNHIGTARLHKNLIRSILNTKPLVVVDFSSIGRTITLTMSLIFHKDKTIASVWSICSPSTEYVARKMMMIPFSHVIGWNVLANFTPCLTKVLAQGHTKVFPWVTS